MEKKKVSEQLLKRIDRLEKSARKVVETRGYTNEVEKIKILQELLREQIRDENSHRSARES